MKRFITKVFFWVVLAYFYASCSADIHPVVREAQRLVLAGAYEEAITEYKRYLFFNPDSPSVEIYLSIADLYRDKGMLFDAQLALQSALTVASSDSMRDAIRIENSLLEMAEGKYPEAQMELLRIVSFSEKEDLRNRAALFLCLSHVLAGEWNAAIKISSGGVASIPVNNRLRLLDSLLRKIPRYSHKSPIAAKWMSTVLPGLGQIYAHDVRNGLNALAISGVTLFMTVYSISYSYYTEAIILDVPLFWRYYSGNRWHASDAAEKYNAQKDRAMQKKIMELLLQAEQLL
jgi:tetratricopeptide (TPR) repeat protein